VVLLPLRRLSWPILKGLVLTGCPLISANKHQADLASLGEDCEDEDEGEDEPITHAVGALIVGGETDLL
jgi:hypothetical protein